VDPLKKKKLWAAGSNDGRVMFIEKGEELCTFLSFDDTRYSPRYLASLPEALDFYGLGPEHETSMISGVFYPRIYRGEDTPPPHHINEREVAHYVAAVRSTRMVFSKLETLFNAVEPWAGTQDSTWGLLQREILILACAEVESAWRSVILENQYQRENADGSNLKFSTNDYVKLLKPMRLKDWKLSLSSHRHYREIQPFRDWSKERPTASLPWYDAYNTVKHGGERKLSDATFGHAVDAAAAAFIMTVAQFGLGHLAGAAHFHPDIFSIAAFPKWLPTERYIPPCNKGLAREEWLGSEHWFPVFCPDITPDQF